MGDGLKPHATAEAGWYGGEESGADRGCGKCVGGDRVGTIRRCGGGSRYAKPLRPTGDRQCHKPFCKRIAAQAGGGRNALLSSLAPPSPPAVLVDPEREIECGEKGNHTEPERVLITGCVRQPFSRTPSGFGNRV